MPHMNKIIKPKSSKAKRWYAQVHLYGGLGIGLLVFIISLTGALYVFKDEVQNSLRASYIYHHESDIQHKKVLGLTVLEQKLNAQHQENYPIHWVEVPMDKSKSYKFHYYERQPKAWHYFEELAIYKTAYINPFTGQLLAVEDEKHGFFNIVKYIHWSFLLKAEWGTYVVGIPVLVFVLMLITGIILWWPKTKGAAKQRLWFRWKNIKNWRRKNYDLHSILGFYSSFVALIIAITGLFYAFVFVPSAIFFVFSGGETEFPMLTHIVGHAPASARNIHTLDKMAHTTEALYPKANSYSLDFGYPRLDGEKHPNFQVWVQQYPGRYDVNHQLVFDENSGELLHQKPHESKGFGEKVIGANYDIHVGAIWGLWGKILALVCSLICASLPITGFLVWRGRQKKTSR
jgi:uncharacterized iron-regulated membrane protein